VAPLLEAEVQANAAAKSKAQADAEALNEPDVVFATDDALLVDQALSP
jgi:hypothetical protein